MMIDSFRALWILAAAVLLAVALWFLPIMVYDLGWFLS